jgi:DNA-binding NarL/FixJ family response regulator
MHPFETNGFDSLGPTRVSDVATAFPPGEERMASRGWSCATERRAGVPLSPRERQILTLIVDGKTRKEVAYELAIAHSTVRVIYSRAMKKLGGAWRPSGRRA